MADIRTQTVEFPTNGDTGTGYLAIPQGDGPFPGVIVVQEWWGLDDHIKDVAQRFAGEGFVAFAPDLYHGKVTAEPNEAQKLMMSLDMNRAGRRAGEGGRAPGEGAEDRRPWHREHWVLHGRRAGADAGVRQPAYSCGRAVLRRESKPDR